MIGIIWYKIKQNGFNKFNKIIEDYERLGIRAVAKRIRGLSGEVHFENGDVWSCWSASEQRRGLVCNVSLVERGIDSKIENVIIKPCTRAFPYQAIDYYEGRI